MTIQAIPETREAYIPQPTLSPEDIFIGSTERIKDTRLALESALSAVEHTEVGHLDLTVEEDKHRYQEITTALGFFACNVHKLYIDETMHIDRYDFKRPNDKGGWLAVNAAFMDGKLVISATPKDDPEDRK